jgi:4-amino-4-deoxy-L-arabinose transferase-like glycosyltransferase
MWLAFGMAFFTKGPPALLPLIPLAVFHARSRRVRMFFDFGGILVFVVTAFWWFAAVSARHPELVAYFLGKEVVARNVSSVLSRNAEWYGPLTIYAPVLLLGQGAWCYYSFRMIQRRELYKPARVRQLFRTRVSAGLFLFLWFVIPMVVFCLSRSRLQLYILPLFAPISLATGRFIVLSFGNVAFRQAVRIGAISVLVIVAAKALGAYVPARKDMAQLYGRARGLAGGQAQYKLYRERELYGFQFYAGEHVGRVTSSGKEPWADQSLGALMDEIVRKPTAGTYVIISSTYDAGALKSALTDANVGRTEVEGHGWKLFVVRRERD